MNSRLIIFILFTICFSRLLSSQIDTNKRYICNLTIKSDTVLSNLNFILKNKRSVIKKTETYFISNLAFYKNDSIEMIIEYNNAQMRLINFSSYFPYSDFSHSVVFHLYHKTTPYIMISQFDGRSGNEIVIDVNGRIIDNKKTPYHFIEIGTSNAIQLDKNTYETLNK